MLDYHADAIVNDPLFGKPLVGKLAIATHKTAEMIALSDVDLKVTDRWTMGGELTAIWEVTGLHSGPYYNLPATEPTHFDQRRDRDDTARRQDHAGDAVLRRGRHAPAVERGVVRRTRPARTV